MTAKKTTTTTKRKGKTTTRPKPFKQDYRARIVVTFYEDLFLSSKADAARSIKDYNIGPWELMAKKYPGITIEPLFSNIDPEKLKGWIKKAKEMDPTYKEGDFFKYFKVTCPVESSPEVILSELAGWKQIKKTYINKSTSNPAVTYTNDPKANDNLVDPYQKYLDAAPDGISAKSVWDSAVPGSDSTLIQFIDIEKGWTLEHEDLGLSLANLLWGTIDDTKRAHGTSVLGIVGAKDNTLGCVGIAPYTTLNVISSNGTTTANAILQSLNYLGFGDVLLIEETNPEDLGTEFADLPVETTDSEFDAIRLATALGIIVIEPGGNGTESGAQINFDTYQKDTLPILTYAFRDSGAIIVSASHSVVIPVTSGTDTINTHEKLLGTPIGNRVDCYAWGENIITPTSDATGVTDKYAGIDPGYTPFDGTSGAAAIIAGTVLSMQGMALSNQGYRFSPGQIRNILRDSLYGTQLSVHTFGTNYDLKNIFMPDLQKFASLCLNSLPDIFLRDFVGDLGDPHAGEMSWSPDVIIQNSSVAPNQQSLFGDFSSDYRDVNAIKNQPNYLYFRALNRGGVTATGVTVTVFYSDPSTLITPSSMNLIGEVGFPDIGSDLSAISVRSDILTVSNELVWNVPDTTGHFCFVAFITCDQDPYLDPKTIVDTNWSWDTFYHFIRNNNNVTWKNFNIVEMTKKSSSSPAPEEDPEHAQAPEPDPVEEQDPKPEPKPTPGAEPDPYEHLPKKGWLTLDFFSPGLPDRDQKMSLEVLSKLPRGVKVLLQIPLTWKRMVYRGSPYVLHNKKKRIGYAPINPLGKSQLEDILFRANSKTHLKLFIYVPDKLKNKSYIIAVRQMLEGKEVGRLTWKLVPPDKIKKPIPRRVLGKKYR